MAQIKSDDTQYTLETTKNISLKNDRSHCLSFWYYEDGEGGFMLKIYSSVFKLSERLSQIEKRKKWSLIQKSIDLQDEPGIKGKFL